MTQVFAIDETGDIGFRRLSGQDATDHGYVVINGGTYDDPIPVVLLATRHPFELSRCESLADFAQALTNLPHGFVLHGYDRCGPGEGAGIDRSFYAELEACVTQHGGSVAADRVIVCTCP